jgi:hypothetical protein
MAFGHREMFDVFGTDHEERKIVNPTYSGKDSLWPSGTQEVACRWYEIFTMFQVFDSEELSERCNDSMFRTLLEVPSVANFAIEGATRVDKLFFLADTPGCLWLTDDLSHRLDEFMGSAAKSRIKVLAVLGQVLSDLATLNISLSLRDFSNWLVNQRVESTATTADIETPQVTGQKLHPPPLGGGEPPPGMVTKVCLNCYERFAKDNDYSKPSVSAFRYGRMSLEGGRSAKSTTAKFIGHQEIDLLGEEVWPVVGHAKFSLILYSHRALENAISVGCQHIS